MFSFEYNSIESIEYIKLTKYVDDGCDSFWSECKQKLTCDIYEELKDEWEWLYPNN